MIQFFNSNKELERMSPYFTLCRKIVIRSTEFNIYYKPDAIHGAIFKIAELEGRGGRVVNKIYATLDVATELCERLHALEQFYQEFRPLPRNAQLKYEEMVEQDSTYKLNLTVRQYRQHLQITQTKKRLTRGPCDSIAIPDIGDFRRELAQLIEEMSNLYLPTFVETDESGISKVIRGDRVAVIYCSVRPWPWTRSYPTTELLHDPVLVALIHGERDVNRIREYCENTYPDLMVDTYVDMNYEPSDSAVLYDYLKIRWIRRGQRFRVNERPGTIALPHEDHWFIA